MDVPMNILMSVLRTRRMKLVVIILTEHQFFTIKATVLHSLLLIVPVIRLANRPVQACLDSGGLRGFEQMKLQETTRNGPEISTEIIRFVLKFWMITNGY